MCSVGAYALAGIAGYASMNPPTPAALSLDTRAQTQKSGRGRAWRTGSGVHRSHLAWWTAIEVSKGFQHSLFDYLV